MVAGLAPKGNVRVVGCTVIPLTGMTTLTIDAAEKPPSTVVVVIVTVPVVSGVTTPLLTVATSGLVVDQVTD